MRQLLVVLLASCAGVVVGTALATPVTAVANDVALTALTALRPSSRYSDATGSRPDRRLLGFTVRR